MLGIIGGSGLYHMEGVEIEKEIMPETPYGLPSASIKIGKLEGKRVAFLPRHGVGHTISPSQVNYRANIYSLRLLGCDRILSVSAVGSLKEDVEPGDLVIPRQFIDLTRGRKSTFFDGSLVVHVSMADPVCPEMSSILKDAALAGGHRVHDGGVYICIEGPQFSTKAESNLYRSMGGWIIGMTNMPEAKLARELEMCYATLALVTDYDCWKEDRPPVSAEEIIETLNTVLERSKDVVRRFVSVLPEERSCFCKDALRGAITTDLGAVSEEDKKRMGIVLDKYLSSS